MIEVDNELASEALELSGLAESGDAVKLALILFVQMRLRKQRKIRRFRGKFASFRNHQPAPGERNRAIQ